MRTALVTFGVDASHGYERIHMHALRSCAELLTAFALSGIDIARDTQAIGDLGGFPRQPSRPAHQSLGPDSGLLRTRADIARRPATACTRSAQVVGLSC